MNDYKPSKSNTDNALIYNTKNLSNSLYESTNDKDERAAIIEAIKIGYLLYPSKELIWDIFKKQVDYDDQKCRRLVRKQKNSRLLITESFENDYSKILYLNMNKTPLFEIGDLFLCRNIVILNLSNNFLMNIEPLFNCIHLLRLDLQNNQINKLPNGEFWSRLEKLKVLFLHNNLIGKLEYLKYLSFCPSLEILSLYDSPISLKNNYRHHAVNSIVTLKSLDNYVISDEEIIEEANFKNYFSAGSEKLRINIDTKTEENSFKSELRATNELLRLVNQIMARNSPVLIIQRYTRGFLVRNRLNKIKMEEKINAAVKIQRWWRVKRFNLKFHKQKENFKEISNIEKNESRLLTTEFKMTKKNETKRNNTPITFQKQTIYLNLKKLNRQSTFESITAQKSPKFPRINQKQNNSIQKSDRSNFREELITSIVKDTQFDSGKLIKISQMLADFNESIEISQIPNEINFDYISFLINQINKKLKRNKDEMNKEQSIIDDQEYDPSKFRLPILEPKNDIIKTKDKYVIDFIKDKVRDINAIKTLDVDAHKKATQIKQIEKIEPKEFLTNDQRFFQRIYGNMTIGCLRAVDKAYEERNINDRKLLLKKKCEESRNNQKSACQEINMYKEDRKKEIRDNAFKCKENLTETRKKYENDYEELCKSVREKRERMINFKKNRRRDLLLAIEFSKQHISVSKALNKHEFLMRKENILKEKADFVLDYKTDMESQNDLVKRFIQQRIAMRQIQTSNSKHEIEARIKKEKEQQTVKTKDRVRLLKSIQPVGYQPLETCKFDFIPPGSIDFDFYNEYESDDLRILRDDGFMERLDTKLHLKSSTY